MVGVLLPMLFATECCANMCARAISLNLHQPRRTSPCRCTESCNNMMGIAVAMCITFLKRLRR